MTMPTPEAVYEHGSHLRDEAEILYRDLGSHATHYSFMPDSMTTWTISPQDSRYSQDLHPVRHRLLPVYNAILGATGMSPRRPEDEILARRTDITQPKEEVSLRARKPLHVPNNPDMSLLHFSDHGSPNVLYGPDRLKYLGEFMELNMGNLAIECGQRSSESGIAEFQRMSSGLRQLSEVHNKQPYDGTRFAYNLGNERFASISSSRLGYQRVPDSRTTTEPYIDLSVYSSLEALRKGESTATLAGIQAPDGRPTVATIDHVTRRSASIVNPVSLDGSQTDGLLRVFDQLTSQPDKAMIQALSGDMSSLADMERTEADLRALPPAETMIDRVGLTF